MAEKNLGYTLLVFGIAIMLITVGIIILTLTGHISPMKVFDIPAPSFNTSSFMPSIPGLPRAAGTDISFIQKDSFNKMINLGIEFMLMYFILSFGYKLADLGVKLVRPIKIEAKQA